MKMALVMDHKYPVYYTIPDNTEIGLIKFYFDAPIIAGDLVSAIANTLIPMAVATQGGQVPRIKVWKDSVGTLVYRWTTEFHVFLPQAVGTARFFAWAPILAAIGAWLSAHAGQILAIIGISIVIERLIDLVYGPVDPNTGDREKPKVGPEQYAMALLIVAGAVALILYMVMKYKERKAIE